LPDPSDEQLAKSVASAEAFIFPALDDFGISAVEALSAGTPVIAFKGGGALDYVVEGRTGVFFSPQTADALSLQLKKFDSKQFSSSEIKKSAQAFSQSAFQNKMKNAIERAMALL